ncbi:Chromosome partitioning protein ParA [Vibrio crassostreae]|uniref:AAA family ATPase n=1 Tax=Vibrio TaxID=662 RepID=UPI0005E69933|nr:AAA family ATPase [Vibrio crassostreae]TCL15467.1 plasmid segregation oscillating ATPase ParF [Vibrio crassostreae]TCT95537.1 plasmid segregation oscillating ATPase ParF [Vibrio crassostreae]CAK1808419.1 Chromosome partitioning protein ParA [Vibrio crassostreae]CAK1945504.1 Chromosome partitioning protein ParA [Vibrio crassostreae]CAK1948965.1 Chromosome partitioning protein ParA [Vibrio crassostreae]
MGKVILLGHQKGGVGKSNTAANLAVAISKERFNGETDDILLIDADPQATLYRWAQRREELDKVNAFPCIRLDGNVTKQIKRESEKYSYVIVDAAGRDSREMRSAMLAADLMLMPTKASLSDLELLEHMADTIEAARDYNSDLKVGVFINMSPTNSQSEKKVAKELLREFPEFVLLNTVVSERKAHRDAWSEAVGVHEWKDSKAKAEISCLLKDVQNEIES